MAMAMEEASPPMKLRGRLGKGSELGQASNRRDLDPGSRLSRFHDVTNYLIE